MSSRDFDGVDDLITAGSNAVLNAVTSVFTVLAWVMMDSASINQAITCKGDEDDTNNPFSYYLRINSNNRIHFRTRDIGGNGDDVIGGTTLSAGVWYFVGGQRITLGAASRDFVFLNGRTDGSTGPPNNVLRSTAAENQLIGCRRAVNSNTNFFNGKISHLHIYNTLIVSSLQTQIMRIPASIQSSLVGYWPLWGGSPEGDYSGYRNNGVVSGTTVSPDNPGVNQMFIAQQPVGEYAF